MPGIRFHTMLHQLLLVVGFASLISSPVLGYEQHLDGFPGTRWGMSEKQVQELFEGRLAKVAIPGANSQILGLKYYDVDKCDCYVNFYFANTGLSRVGLGLNDERQ